MQGKFRIIGVVHLLPLPGSPGYKGSLNEVVERAIKDARSLMEGGVHGIIVENFNDVPFYKDAVPSETVSSFTAVALEIKKNLKDDVLFGINVLRNDALSALAIALAVDADFIRINVPVGAVITPSGIIEGKINEIARKRKMLGADEISFYEDVMVKHAWQFGNYSISDWAVETEKRGLADVIIVSGARTGESASVQDVKEVKESVSVPVFIGSGITPDNIKEFASIADGAIVGTYFEGGVPGAPVDVQKVKDFMRLVESL